MCVGGGRSSWVCKLASELFSFVHSICSNNVLCGSVVCDHALYNIWRLGGKGHAGDCGSSEGAEQWTGQVEEKLSSGAKG